MTVHIDLSQIVQSPERTGIQRAERALLQHWPGPAPLVPCMVDAGGRLVTLPDAVLRALLEPAPPGGLVIETRRIARHLRPGRPVPEAGLRLLNVELFADPVRAAAHQRLAAGPAQLSWLIYDLLPWMQPDWFPPGSARRMMPFIQAMRAVPRLAFISEQTRADVARVLRRPQPGPVIPMGADGLGIGRQTFGVAKRDFVMLGTIEPRKNAALAMRAFQLLWRDGVEASLTLIGHARPEATEERALLDALRAEPRFRHLQHLPDAGVQAALQGARAMLFPSEGEGYGIPPMEALHAGIPVIVAASLPALQDMPAAGQVRLAPVTPASIADAVRQMLDDAEAARLWQAAATMRPPSWQDFANRIAGWVQGDASVG